jgi:hypothetical protein
MPLPWIKLYCEILEDPKMGKMPEWLFCRCIKLFLIAGREGKDGQLPPVEDMTWTLRLDETNVAQTLQCLAEVGVTLQADDGIWMIVNFSKRQMLSDGARRTRKYREGLKKQNEHVMSHVTSRVSTSLSDSFSLSEGEGVGGGTTAPADREEPCLSPLSAAFVNATKIPELTGGPPRWIAALETMQKAGVEPIDVTMAVQEMRNKDYSITTLASIVNPAITAMSKRKTGGKTESSPGYLLPMPSLLCGAGVKLKKWAESKYASTSFPKALEEYEDHIKGCELCGGGSTSSAAQVQIRELANKMKGAK